jgi:hypothetical protein
MQMQHSIELTTDASELWRQSNRYARGEVVR